MGRMLRMRQWNMSVLPSPFPDNGIEINGTHTGDNIQLDYAVYGVMGFKADLQPTDINFQLNRRPEACRVYDELVQVYPNMRDEIRRRLPQARTDAHCGAN